MAVVSLGLVAIHVFLLRTYCTCRRLLVDAALRLAGCADGQWKASVCAAIVGHEGVLELGAWLGDFSAPLCEPGCPLPVRLPVDDVVHVSTQPAGVHQPNAGYVVAIQQHTARNAACMALQLGG